MYNINNQGRSGMDFGYICSFPAIFAVDGWDESRPMTVRKCDNQDINIIETLESLIKTGVVYKFPSLDDDDKTVDFSGAEILLKLQKIVPAGKAKYIVLGGNNRLLAAYICQAVYGVEVKIPLKEDKGSDSVQDAQIRLNALDEHFLKPDFWSKFPRWQRMMDNGISCNKLAILGELPVNPKTGQVSAAMRIFVKGIYDLTKKGVTLEALKKADRVKALAKDSVASLLKSENPAEEVAAWQVGGFAAHTKVEVKSVSKAELEEYVKKCEIANRLTEGYNTIKAILSGKEGFKAFCDKQLA